jgi:hypothetical protein
MSFASRWCQACNSGLLGQTRTVSELVGHSSGRFSAQHVSGTRALGGEWRCRHDRRR